MNPAFGKLLIALGVLLIVVGLILVSGVKIPWLGHLPGDISIKRDNFQIYAPITTCILLSLLLSFLLYLFRK